MLLAHTDHGHAGTPLIILHGLFGSGRNWGSIARTLSGHGYHVFCLDLPNHGNSPWTDGPVDYVSMANTVMEWMDRQGLHKAIVLGHSMGGKIAMTMALHHPEHVERLLVVDIAPVDYGSAEHRTYIQAMEAVNLVGVTRRAEVEAQLAHAIPEESLRKFLTQNLVTDESRGHLKWQINLRTLDDSMDAIRAFPATVETSPYRNPALFLVGGQSGYVTSRGEARIQALFPYHALVRMDGCGHWPHAEAPGTFIGHVLEFLQQG
ncbi:MULTISPECIES: alpha/beta fold hydrolase [unclassified Haematospirillum]|uniref:alpha/beta fold hydrolase n=1 Tax=unclassified Haematospirillum TaxID=2622088 RepID=UPI00143BB80B|nr:MULTISPECIES: alpha/beta fold hydrolase [unclassified Haematospirillum]NKD54050.1 alpha/beta fold hydrolase [Haematospirillum sp. H4890]NKD74095.1 alpha/beta fold hydrolase [Haematospirillum sp. H4485]